MTFDQIMAVVLVIVAILMLVILAKPNVNK